MACRNMVSDEVTQLFQWVVYSGVSQFIAVFGMIANIMNIICFIKLRFKDSINVALLGKEY